MRAQKGSTPLVKNVAGVSFELAQYLQEEFGVLTLLDLSESLTFAPHAIEDEVSLKLGKGDEFQLLRNAMVEAGYDF